MLRLREIAVNRLDNKQLNNTSSARENLQMNMDITTNSGVQVSDKVQFGPFTVRAMAIAAVWYCILAVLITVSNILVIGCFVVWRPLRTPPNAITVSLAVTDLIVGSILNPQTIFMDWSSNSFFLCYVYFSADMCIVSASLLHILALTVDRYVALSRPF